MHEDEDGDDLFVGVNVTGVLVGIFGESKAPGAVLLIPLAAGPFREMNG